MTQSIFGAAAPTPAERAAPSPRAAVLLDVFDGRLGRLSVALKAGAGQVAATGRFAASHAPQDDGRDLVFLRGGGVDVAAPCGSPLASTQRHEV